VEKCCRGATLHVWGETFEVRRYAAQHLTLRLRRTRLDSPSKGLSVGRLLSLERLLYLSLGVVWLLDAASSLACHTPVTRLL